MCVCVSGRVGTMIIFQNKLLSIYTTHLKTTHKYNYTDIYIYAEYSLMKYIDVLSSLKSNKGTKFYLNGYK